MKRMGCLCGVFALLSYSGCSQDLCESQTPAFQLNVNVDPGVNTSTLRKLIIEHTVGGQTNTKALQLSEGSFEYGHVSVVITVGETGKSGFDAEVLAKAFDEAGALSAKAEGKFSGTGNACNVFEITLSPATVPDGGIDGGTDGSVGDQMVPDAMLPDAPVIKTCSEDKECNDDLTCTTDKCDADKCTNIPETGFCVIDKQCIQDKTMNPNNECQRCDAVNQPFRWTSISDTPCDDKDSCTHTDKCVQGVCQGTSYSCDDKLACTKDSCTGDKDGCKHEILAGCLIGGVCYAEKLTNPQNMCQICNSQSSAEKWSDNNNVSCDDKVACTYDDLCKGGICAGTQYDCDDKLACTKDTCTGVKGGCKNELVSGCLIGNVCYKDGEPNPKNKCQVCDSVKSKTSWSPIGQGTKCDDGISCTYDDQCKNGVCEGTKYSCDDGISCTYNNCTGDGNCKYPLMANYCLIDKQCYVANATNPSAKCQYCNLSNPTSWTLSSNSCLISGTCYSSGAKNPSNLCQYCNTSKPTTWTSYLCKSSDTTCLPSTGYCCPTIPICKKGESECVTSSSVHSCVINNTTGCAEWGITLFCMKGYTCTNGKCSGIIIVPTDPKL